MRDILYKTKKKSFWVSISIMNQLGSHGNGYRDEIWPNPFGQSIQDLYEWRKKVVADGDIGQLNFISKD